MNENKNKARVKCTHEGCGKEFNIVLPQKPGTYKYQFPCGHENTIKFVPKDIKFGGSACTEGKTPDNCEGSKPANVVECPWDCGTKFKFEVKDDGEKECSCPQCNGVIKIKIENGRVVNVERKPTVPLNKANDPTNVGKGKLTMVRFHGFLGGIGNKSFMLHLGQNTIGRYDEELPCDIEIRGDTYASRRSVVIEVIDKHPGCLFKMTVLRSANPVMHNNRPLIVGEAVYLNFGDSIKLGNTVFNFEKA